MEEDIFVAAHLTITEENRNEIGDIISRLASTGIAALSLSASTSSLNDVLQEAQNLVYEHDLELVWDIPVPYSSHNPISVELEMAEDAAAQNTSGVARGWLYVEPDGDVLPSQGVNEILGNLLRDSWEAVWEKAKQYRENL
jgi:MoaA/NifB/PqqE/SkfB family radical SAM enzyme